MRFFFPAPVVRDLRVLEFVLEFVGRVSYREIFLAIFWINLFIPKNNLQILLTLLCEKFILTIEGLANKK